MKESKETESEQLVSMLCKRSFLSLWSYSRPEGKKRGKELCDSLVVCDPDVIIFSVKECKVPDSGNLEVDWERWRRAAVEESYKQAYGAQRIIGFQPSVVTREGKDGLPYPDASRRQIHRLVVAFGAQRKAPFSFGDFGKGFVHVIDEISLLVLMTELDTITDFVQYLTRKEAFFSSGVKALITGGEEDILAYYISNNYSFPANCDYIEIGAGLWADFQKRPEYKAKKTADQESYIWDNLIEDFCGHFQKGTLEFGNDLSDVETVTRIMARENRFSRRILGKSFKDFMDQKGRVASRYIISDSGIAYVFLVKPHGFKREDRMVELAARCAVVRGLYPKLTTVVGIATEEYVSGRGYSLDAFYFYKPVWTPEDQELMETVQRELGYFANPLESKMREDEYPGSWPE